MLTEIFSQELWSCPDEICFFRINYALLDNYFSSRPQKNAHVVDFDIYETEHDLRNLRYIRDMSLECWRDYVQLKRQLAMQKEKLRKVVELEDIAKRIVKEGKAEWSQWESKPADPRIGCY